MTETLTVGELSAKHLGKILTVGINSQGWKGSHRITNVEHIESGYTTINGDGLRNRVCIKSDTICTVSDPIPEWFGSRVIQAVQELTAFYYLFNDEHEQYIDETGDYWTWEDLLDSQGDITVILDKHGNPPKQGTTSQPEVTEKPSTSVYDEVSNGAWAHYRKTYSPNPDCMAAAHKAFHYGWDMAKEDTNG